ncbi:MAG: YitT family protein [Lachnospiraceae bacterium]|nr:YitT family protein [Lachnospiraceae bacterium]
MAKNKSGNVGKDILWVLTILIGCALYAFGFDYFWAPHGFNGGGTSGLALVFVTATGIGSTGLINFILNLPLFVLGYAKIGRRFFVGSLIGMLSTSIFLDLFSRLPVVEMEPMLAVLYGGAISGVGLGLVMRAGASGGGTDILVRLLKLRFPNASAGSINLVCDATVVILTAIVFKNVMVGLYCGIAIVVYAQVFDAVIYSFDYSKVAMIISAKHEAIAEAITVKMDRGVTYLYGEGYYSHHESRIILTAISKRQLAELKELVVEIDPDAFVIIQESHQVLGNGFAHYSKTDL